MTSYMQLNKLSHSLQDRFRQAKFLKVLIYLSDIITASERLLDTLERILGGVLQKIFYLYHAEELKYISDIFVTNKYVLLCFYFNR